LARINGQPQESLVKRAKRKAIGLTQFHARWDELKRKYPRTKGSIFDRAAQARVEQLKPQQSGYQRTIDVLRWIDPEAAACYEACIPKQEVYTPEADRTLSMMGESAAAVLAREQRRMSRMQGYSKTIGPRCKKCGASLVFCEYSVDDCCVKCADFVGEG
jgi:hypothetical protein